MRRITKKTIAITVITACLAGLGMTTAQAAKLNMSYLYFGSPEAFVRQVDASQASLNRVSPVYFDLTPEGELKLVSNISILVKAMKERGIKVVPFLSNHWDREIGRKALANREALTSRIAEAVVQYGLDGVNVDIENVTEQDRDAYTDLVRLLRQKLPAGTEVSVAIAANPKEWTKGWQASYDLAALSRYSDYLMLMSYDEHWDGSPEPGPVASLPWVEQSVKQVLKYTTPDKVLLGIPFYGRYWKEGGGITGSGISNKNAEAIAKRYGITPTYDETAQSAVFTFTVTAGEEPPMVGSRKLEPGTYTVWYDNERSIKRKLDLVHQYNLRGTGSWCLSQESPDTWLYYSSWLNGSYYSDAAGHWADSDIRAVAQKGWMTGTSSIAFSPQAPLTRAQAAAILVRALRLAEKTPTSSPAAASFKDVPASYWGRSEIELARRNGLVDGFADGTFAPDRPVTREQLSAMLFRALGKTNGGTAGLMAQPAQQGQPGEVSLAGQAGAQAFKDMSPARWSWEAVGAMQQKGLLQGYPDGTFRPAATMTRAEAAVLLLRSEDELEATIE